MNNNPPNYTNIKRINTKFLVLVSFILVFISGLPALAGIEGASFYLSPSQGTYRIGTNFLVDVMISAKDISLNAAQAKIFFSPDKLKVLEILKQNSIFTLWVKEPIFSNSEGEIYFVGGLPSPGFQGEAGKVFSIIFQAKSFGEAKINFDQEMIMANTPEGIDIFSFSQLGSYAISRGGIYSILTLEELPPELLEDKYPPFPFEITVDNEGDPTNPRPLFYFKTEDDISGISHYEVKIGKEIFKVNQDETFPWRTPNLTPGNYSILIKAIDRAGNFTESKTEVKIESISVPKITICPKVFKAGEELLYLEGNALPKGSVLIFFEKNGKVIKDWEVLSDEDGNWSLKEDFLLKSGMYTISAKAKDLRGAESYPSESCFVKVILEGITIGPFILSYKNLTLAAFCLLIILVCILSFFLLRIQRTRKLIKIEAEDLKKKFYKEYNELKLDIEKELELLKNVMTKRELTESERERERELLKNLADVERVLREELKDIEKIK